MLSPVHFRTLGVGSSLLLHLALAWGLSTLPKRAAVPDLHSLVEFEVRAPEPPAPRVPSEEPREPLQEPSAPAAPRAASPEPPPLQRPEPTTEATAPSEPGESPALDLTGLTLTNDSSNGSWASQVGNGMAMSDPLRSGGNGRRAASEGVRAKAEPAKSGPIVVPLSDLSERPVPPQLDALLEQHYPPVARQQGKSGEAIVRLRIEPSGQVHRVELISESETGFGAACRSTLVGSLWAPPRNRAGQAVATMVNYTCRFRAKR